jgi:hypothetical protein
LFWVGSPEGKCHPGMKIGNWGFRDLLKVREYGLWEYGNMEKIKSNLGEEL